MMAFPLYILPKRFLPLLRLDKRLDFASYVDDVSNVLFWLHDLVLMSLAISSKLYAHLSCTTFSQKCAGKSQQSPRSE